VGAFVYSMLWFINGFLLLVAPQEGKALTVAMLSGLVFLGGQLAINRALHNVVQLNALLSDLSKGVEPRHLAGRSAEAEYAIEHPLIGPRTPTSDSEQALHLYRESLTHLHAGDQGMAANLEQQATSIDPSLHERARENLSGMAQDSKPANAGPIYYWLGVHSEILGDSRQAADWYEKASDAFGRLGYEKRQGRACSNLGSVHGKLGNHVSALAAFEKAISLNSADGIAHINIGLIYYYSGKDPGSPEHERALDSFADGILADPDRYGPRVAAYMRSYSYGWEEDLRKVLQRVSNKQR
jgi:tetratricopeptide (TPR) repeat protein